MTSIAECINCLENHEQNHELMGTSCTGYKEEQEEENYNLFIKIEFLNALLRRLLPLILFFLSFPSPHHPSSSVPSFSNPAKLFTASTIVVHKEGVDHPTTFISDPVYVNVSHFTPTHI